ncbi:hypothetical protein ONZ45_g2115 [Pleurotus djamor]|nr:hypothetical protein ONZ45_g12356 [Pleurotus djamor]KAJ8521208.1 hypothetical protein ONZ45_g2115 [Pleurotus djamor]
MALIKVLLRIVLYMAVFWLWFSMISFVSLMTSTSASNFDDCIGGETEPSQLLVQTCTAYVHAFRDPKVITMFILLIVVLPIVAQLYGYYIVRAYYKKLRWAESLNEDLEMDSKNQAWTIDGPNIEPPDWKTLSRTTSQVDLTLPTPSSQQVDAELVPLTTSIGSSHASPTPVEAGSEKRSSKGKGKATTMDDVII